MANEPPLPIAAAESRTRRLLAFLLMCAGVIAVYVPTRELPEHNIQRSGDYHVIHSRRIAYAREHLLAHKAIPGWYSRESLGTPFWSNIQNFPFIPTRLIVLWVPPAYLFTVSVVLAALLAATFTFFYARALALPPIGAAAAGWTFACAGINVAHVFTGQLPMIEVYPALPLLAWLIEINYQSAERCGGDDGGGGGGTAGADLPRPLLLAALAFASACVAVAGHPQLGIYAFGVAGLLLVWRGWGQWRRMLVVTAAVGLGVASAAFVLWPTLLLVGRSTRTLSLVRDNTNIPFPYWRLPAWLMPWRNGAGYHIRQFVGRFTGGDDYPDFFETVSYVGVLPLVAGVSLVAVGLIKLASRQRCSRVSIFWTVLAVGALVTALPLFHPGEGSLALTLLRNPTRQRYVTTFALALALGAYVKLIRARATSPDSPRRQQRLLALLIPVMLAGHAYDLADHDRSFIRTMNVPTRASPEIAAAVDTAVGTDGRAAVDVHVLDPVNRRYDDIGFFDSIILARPYATLLDLAGLPPGTNVQTLDGSHFGVEQLEALGVRIVVAFNERPRLGTPLLVDGFNHVYRLANPLPRAMFLPAAAAVYTDPATMHRRLREHSGVLRSHVMLPGSPPSDAVGSEPLAGDLPARVTAVEYARPNSDEIVVQLRDKGAGFLRVIESFDPGWRAEVNGVTAPVLVADDTFLAVAVPPGSSVVRFTYHTPGATTGGVISIAGVLSLSVGLLRVRAIRARRS